MKTSTSPVVTNSDFHIASPLPGWVPRSGRISADRWTVAPASSATAYVSSVESESITTISSSSSTVSTSASRLRVTTSPTVAASLRAGTTRLTDVSAFAASRSSSVQSSQWWVFRSNQPMPVTVAVTPMP